MLVSIAATHTSANTHFAGSKAKTFVMLLKRRKITPFINAPARLIAQIKSVKVNGVDFCEFSVSWKSLSCSQKRPR